MVRPNFSRDASADYWIDQFRTRYEIGPDPSNSNVVDNLVQRPNDRRMTDLNQQLVDAKLQATEARMDGRVAAIQATIDGFVGRMEERSLRTDERFARIEEGQRDTQSSIGSLKSTIIFTAIGTVLTIVLGVAAFNATVLSSMTASFEAGKNTIVSQAELKKQAEDTAALLKQVQQELNQGRRDRGTPASPEK
jgi:hypothetical protein